MYASHQTIPQRATLKYLYSWGLLEATLIHLRNWGQQSTKGLPLQSVSPFLPSSYKQCRQQLLCSGFPPMVPKGLAQSPTKFL